MRITGDIASGIYGAWRLARGDTGGIGYFDNTIQGFWRSFLAMAIVAPLYASVLYLIYDDAADTIDPLRYFSVQALSYIVAWFIFPLIMYYVVRAIDRERRFFAYIAAYNWASVIQNFVYLPVIVVWQIGAVSPEAAGVISLAVKTLVFVYSWFIARAALGITGPMAAAIAAGDTIVSLLLNWVSDGMLH